MLRYICWKKGTRGTGSLHRICSMFIQLTHCKVICQKFPIQVEIFTYFPPFIFSISNFQRFLNINGNEILWENLKKKKWIILLRFPEMVMRKSCGVGNINMGGKCYVVWMEERRKSLKFLSFSMKWQISVRGSLVRLERIKTNDDKLNINIFCVSVWESFLFL